MSQGTTASRVKHYEDVKGKADKVEPAPEFGEGWMLLGVKRQNGKDAGKLDPYWFSPKERYKFRSKAEIKRYKMALEAAPQNDEGKAWAIFKGNDNKSPAVKRQGQAKAGSGGANTVSGPDAGAGHPSAKTKSAASVSKPKQKLQTSRKAHGKGVATTVGYKPTITSTKGHDNDGPYVDEDDVTRVYNYPKNIARKAELEEKGYYEPELDGADDDDGDADGAPYRHITNWFLMKPSPVEGKTVLRMALPADYRKVKNLCLYGELLPSPRKIARARAKGRELPKPLPVVLRRLNLWSIDRDYNDRGIWFQTNDAWYKLEQPSKDKVDGQSQEDLHLELRAKFGLVSNLLDMLTEKSRALNLDNFFGLHDSRTPSESHSVLTPKPEQLERYPGLPTEPFDLDLLQREATFVKQHISDCGVDFAKSNFVKGLTEMEKEWKRIQKSPKKKTGDKKEDVDDEFDYLASAKAAGKRSGRKPWGCLVARGGSEDGDEVPRINRLVEIKVEESRTPERKKQPSAKKTKLSPSSSDQPPAKKKKVESIAKKIAAAAKARSPSPTPASIPKAAKKKKASVEDKFSKSRGEIERAPKAPPVSEKVKVAKRTSTSTSTPADSTKKLRASPPTTSATPTSMPATATTTSGSRNRALLDSDDGGLFSDSSGEEDEWKPPPGTAADKKSKASGAGRGQVVEEVEVPFTVEDTDLYPILIFQVKNKCAQNIRAFIDAAGKIIDIRADAFIKSCVLPNTASSYEFMLAVVESLLVSPPSVLKQLFDLKNPKKCGARRIFVSWLNAARERMKERRDDSIQKAILDAVGDNPKTEEELATQNLRLSMNCFDPAKETSAMTPQRARESYGIDILEITKNVRRIRRFCLVAYVSVSHLCIVLCSFPKSYLASIGLIGCKHYHYSFSMCSSRRSRKKSGQTSSCQCALRTFKSSMQ